MKAWIVGLCVVFAGAAHADAILRLPTDDRVVALTFDACEQHRPVKLDAGISDYLVAHKIPFTLFLSGRFVADNADAL
jgi:peptidoglycan/xylan/chitin deacetylase (PgdA/CDA1 family)